MALLDNALSDSLALGTISYLDKLGIGASKKFEFNINNSNVTFETAKALFSSLASENGWGFISEQKDGEFYTLVLQIGQWGFSISGSQRLFIILKQREVGLSGVGVSKSTMGQLVDWGANQKNLDKLRNFVDRVNQDPAYANRIISNPVLYKPSKKIVNPLFFVLLGVTTVLPTLIFSYYRSVKMVEYKKDFDNNSHIYCDTAKIQYALEKYFEENTSYPSSIGSSEFNSYYRNLFPKEQSVPKDPISGGAYSYSVIGSPGNSQRYELSATLSDGQKIHKDPKIDFPGKNITVGSEYAIPIMPTLYTLPCASVGMLER